MPKDGGGVCLKNLAGQRQEGGDRRGPGVRGSIGLYNMPSVGLQTGDPFLGIVCVFKKKELVAKVEGVIFFGWNMFLEGMRPIDEALQIAMETENKPCLVFFKTTDFRDGILNKKIASGISQAGREAA